MLLFDVIKDVLYKKSGFALQNVDNEAEFVPYMVGRWCSMHSPEVAVIVNNTTNRLWSVPQTKLEWYNMYLNILPRVKYKNIDYIKKPKADKEKVEDTAAMEFLAKQLEISVREVKYYVEAGQIDLAPIKKALK